MYIVQFGDYTLPEQLDMQESQGAARRGSTTPLGGAGGSFDNFGTGPDPKEGGTISKSFTVSAASETVLQTELDNLLGNLMLDQSDWTKGERMLVAMLPDGSKRATWAKCVNCQWNAEYFHINNYWQGGINITWRQSRPGWFDYDNLVYFNSSHVVTSSQTYIAGQLRHTEAMTKQARFTVNNPGNDRVMSGLLSFDGVIVNPTVTNETNGDTFTWTVSAGAGDRLTLNLGNYDARKNGAAGQWSNISIGSGQLLPLVLEPGDNEILITSTTPATEVDLLPLLIPGHGYAAGSECTFKLYFAATYH